MSFRRLPVPKKLFILSAIFSLGLIVYGLWVNRTLRENQVNGPQYARVLESRDFASDVRPSSLSISPAMVHACELSSPALCVENPGRVPGVINDIKEMHRTYRKNLAEWLSKLQDENLKKISTT